MKLSIIVPCFNEDRTIKPLLKNLFDVKFPIDREIIVVDDGSARNLKEIINEEISSKKVKFFRLSKNQGKGVAIRVGLRFAEGDIFIIQDADFEYFPSDIPRLLKPVLNKEADVVYGTRFKSFSKFMAKSHLMGNIMLTKLTNFLYKTNITDMETGYKLFTKDVLNRITLNAREFEFEPEITSKVILKGYTIKEIDIKYQYRDFGVAKINIFDGIESAIVLIQNRYFLNSNSFSFFYKIYKYHFKKIGLKILKIIFHFLRKRI